MTMLTPRLTVLVQLADLPAPVLAHYGDAAWSREAFEALDRADQDRVVDFLKSLQVPRPDGNR